MSRGDHANPRAARCYRHKTEDRDQATASLLEPPTSTLRMQISPSCSQVVFAKVLFEGLSSGPLMPVRDNLGPVGLRGRSLIKEIDFTKVEFSYLIDLSSA